MIWAGTVVATLGALLCLIAAVGLVRLSDPLSRLQAVTKASTLGLALSLTGAVLALPAVDVAGKAVIVVVFYWLVAPVSGHLIGRAAYRTEPGRQLRVDEAVEHFEPPGGDPPAGRA